MTNNTFIDRVRSFFGLAQEPPRNDFRNPIWDSDDEDDEDELYTRQNMSVIGETLDIHHEFTRQMHDMLRSFGDMFGDMRTFFHDDQINSFPAITDVPDEPEPNTSYDIRNYYLKPGYHSHKYEHPIEDIDLDGKISSNEISGLLKRKDGFDSTSVIPFNGTMVPGKSFCKTIITTSVRKPDGTVETRRIVKNGNEVVEETTTSSGPDTPGSLNPGLDPVANTGVIYKHIISELSSLFRNFY